MRVIKYLGNGQVNVEGVCKARKGGTIDEGSIPDDAFNYFASRADFEVLADSDEVAPIGPLAPSDEEEI